MDYKLTEVDESIFLILVEAMYKTIELRKNDFIQPED